MLLFIAMATLGLAAYYIAEVATFTARQEQQAVRRAVRYGRVTSARAAVERLRFRERVVDPAIANLASMALRVNPKISIDTINARLIAAGLASRISSTQFLAIKGGLSCAGLVLGLVYFAAVSPTAGILLIPFFAVAGFMLPESVMTLRSRKRREEIRAQLPDALDVLAVSVEAGLGFDGAVTKLTEHMRGPLVDEFALMLGEIRIGESRQEALRKMTERIPVPEVAAFVRSVIQADQLGISLGRILRVQAADSRLRRQAAAEERAMKAPIKMLFPTVLFVFPAMFLVILGPALLNIGKYF